MQTSTEPWTSAGAGEAAATPGRAAWKLAGGGLTWLLRNPERPIGVVNFTPLFTTGMTGVYLVASEKSPDTATRGYPVSNSQSPLEGVPPAEVPLANAPLVRVVAQVRFPLIASLEKRDFMGSFQEAIRDTYPILRPEQSRSVVFGPEGMVEARTGNIWRFGSSEGDWRVALAPDFLALETGRYTSRGDFLQRFRAVLQALADHVDPQVTDRLGVRYIDQVSGDGHFAALPDLVRPEVAGVWSTPLAAHAKQSITENLFTLPDGSGELKARWGVVPARATVDPAAIEPVDTPSWLLDLDAFVTRTQPLDVDDLVRQATAFAERIYSFFRWTVTTEFLRRYGGDV